MAALTKLEMQVTDLGCLTCKGCVEVQAGLINDPLDPTWTTH